MDPRVSASANFHPLWRPDFGATNQYQQNSSNRNDDSDYESYVPRTPRRTPMACTFCRGELVHTFRIRSAHFAADKSFYVHPSNADTDPWLSRQVANSSATADRSAPTATAADWLAHTFLCESWLNCSSLSAT